MILSHLDLPLEHQTSQTELLFSPNWSHFKQLPTITKYYFILSLSIEPHLNIWTMTSNAYFIAKEGKKYVLLHIFLIKWPPMRMVKKKCLSKSTVSNSSTTIIRRKSISVGSRKSRRLTKHHNCLIWCWPGILTACQTHRLHIWCEHEGWAGKWYLKPS